MLWKFSFLPFLIFLLPNSSAVPPKTCRGTSFGRTETSSTSENRAAFFRERYTNCTTIYGNLEITYLNNREYDLSFLQHVEEVTGYVLIENNKIRKLHLNNLRIIRGTNLINCSLPVECGLFISSHKYAQVSLQQLELVSLREILRGSVHILNNFFLCFSDTIEWTDILSGPYTATIRSDLKFCEEGCDRRCLLQGKKRCWGKGRDMCQKMTKLTCNEHCEHRCKGPQASDCCHKECASGCTGPSSRDCLDCRRLQNGNQCVEACPPETLYDTAKQEHRPNPNVRYAHGALCVEECPPHLLKESNACVKQCSEGKTSMNNTCKTCNGPCPKICEGTSMEKVIDMEKYKGCVFLQGSLNLNDFNIQSTLKDTRERLSAFESLREISGALQVQIKDSSISDLSFLKNLVSIRGTDLNEDWSSFQIMESGLEYLGLQSLKRINNGNIRVNNNKKLCYVDSIDWSVLSRQDDQKFTYNNNTDECGNKTCAAECSKDGCWGPGRDMCLSCESKQFQNECLLSCSQLPLLYQADDHTCRRCHPHCAESCSGPEATQCTKCSHVKDGDFCREECPIGKYKDEKSQCQKCHKNCGPYGCTGPGNNVGLGACASCDLVWFNHNDTDVVGQCLPITDGCPDFYFKTSLHEYEEKHPLNRKYGCKKCPDVCSACKEFSVLTTYCFPCKYFQQEEKCVNFCSPGFYQYKPELETLNQTYHKSRKRNKKYSSENLSLKVCQPCDSNCITCSGPNSWQCLVCKHYVDYFDDEDPTKGFNCTAKCPEHKPFKLTKQVNGEKVTLCVEDGGHSARTSLVIILTLSFIFIVAIIAISTVVILYKRAKKKSKIAYAAATLLGGEMMPLCPSGKEADMSQLQLTGEDSLRIGNKIGQGAFGVVFKGIWNPPERENRLYVAIKVLTAVGQLQDCTRDSILEEAKIMASVRNEYCVPILAVCSASRIMLITQLMPYGSLLDFIRKNHNNISSKVLLNWATQIAKGMQYLESKEIVHRDLAARNVLVQNDNHVRITDFGLAKALEHGKTEYKEESGKLPVKWLALECLQHRIFTHQSDVWSFGITLWEMFTFGQTPYKDVDVHCLIDFIEKGDRLPQPQICTIDVYMVMIKCWLLSADSRPKFTFLVTTFSEMAKDPTRYIYIENDDNRQLKLEDPVKTMRSLSQMDEEVGRPVRDYLQDFEVTPAMNFDQGTSTRVRSPKTKKSPSVNAGSSSKHPGTRLKRYISDPSKDEVNKGGRSPIPSASRHDDEGYLKPDFLDADDAFHNAAENPFDNAYINTPSEGVYTNIARSPDDNSNNNELPSAAFSNPQYFDSGFYFPHHFKKDQPTSPKDHRNNVKNIANNTTNKNSVHNNINKNPSVNYANTNSNGR